MNEVFADTSFYVALIVRSDSRHARALRFSQTISCRIVSTTWVMLELGNFCSATHLRKSFVDLHAALKSSPHVTITPADDYERGLQLFAERPDKSWSLVDCLSFATMRERGIVDALTTDHHFVQAGFNALLI